MQLGPNGLLEGRILELPSETEWAQIFPFLLYELQAFRLSSRKAVEAPTGRYFATFDPDRELRFIVHHYHMFRIFSLG